MKADQFPCMERVRSASILPTAVMEIDGDVEGVAAFLFSPDRFETNGVIPLKPLQLTVKSIPVFRAKRTQIVLPTDSSQRNIGTHIGRLIMTAPSSRLEVSGQLRSAVFFPPYLPA